jgi:hypothetical protein
MMADHAKTTKGNLALPEKFYDAAKWVALIGLPAASAAYFGFGQLWHLPHIEEVVGSIAVLDTFLGSVLGISRASYANSAKAIDGSVTVLPGDDDPIQNLSFAKTDTELANKGTITLKVDSQ